uniref:Immunoglobulin domain-containing protein n=1 Tax=Pygocentrus nattereri TaxID=42514 RepID=A0A3B4EFE7_PYGNA
TRNVLTLLLTGELTTEVRGKVGGAVQLTCRYDHLLPVKGVYFQKKNLSGLYELLVNGFYTNSVKDYLHDEYKHRTRVNRTERSLDFWNLKASDEGHYKCFLMPQDTLKDYDTIFHLTITADYSIPTVTVQECSDHGEGALSCELCCSSFGGYPLANLSWTVLEDSNDVLLQEVGSVSTADKHSGVWNVSQIVRFNCTQPTTVSCSVGGAVSPLLSICERFWAKYTEKAFSYLTQVWAARWRCEQHCRLTARRSFVQFISRAIRVLSVWSLHVLPVSVWLSSRFSSFLPQSKDMQSGQLDMLNCPWV